MLYGGTFGPDLPDVAAHAGLRCVLVQESWVDWPDVTYDRVGNILLSRLMGADVRLVKAGFGIGFKESWEQALAEIEAKGGKPYAIPAGASDHPLGGHGFAGWADEVAVQEREIGVFIDTIIVCSVTGSTQAGMIAGSAALPKTYTWVYQGTSANPMYSENISGANRRPVASNQFASTVEDTPKAITQPIAAAVLPSAMIMPLVLSMGSR